MGYWYLTELMGFVLIPCLLYLQGMNQKRQALVRIAAVMAMIGIILNRLNVSVIAFKIDAPVRYIPSWMEVEVTLAVIFAEVWVFRWFVSRMPVFGKPPKWAIEQDAQEHAAKYPKVVKEAVTWKPQVM
jgi:hypothetical protein